MLHCAKMRGNGVRGHFVLAKAGFTKLTGLPTGASF
jgi:hypothetical protein